MKVAGALGGSADPWAGYRGAGAGGNQVLCMPWEGNVRPDLVQKKRWPDRFFFFFKLFFKLSNFSSK